MPQIFMLPFHYTSLPPLLRLGGQGACVWGAVLWGGTLLHRRLWAFLWALAPLLL